VTRKRALKNKKGVSNMLLPVKTVLRLISVRTAEKEGKKYTFVKLADEATFDSNDFMLHREQIPEKLEVQKRYNVTLDIEGKFTSVQLDLERQKAS
jgi:hypothetical protein